MVGWEAFSWSIKQSRHRPVAIASAAGMCTANFAAKLCCHMCPATRTTHAGLEVRDKAGKVVDNQVVKVFKARKTAESVRDAIAELRPLLPVTVPIQP